MDKAITEGKGFSVSW